MSRNEDTGGRLWRILINTSQQCKSFLKPEFPAYLLQCRARHVSHCLNQAQKAQQGLMSPYWLGPDTWSKLLALLGWLYNMYQSLGSSAVWWVFWLGWISLVRFVLLVDFNLITQETASFPKKMKVLTRQWHQTNSQNNWRKPCMASQSRDMNRI